jgi:hypothetical protein
MTVSLIAFEACDLLFVLKFLDKVVGKVRPKFSPRAAQVLRRGECLR